MKTSTHAKANVVMKITTFKCHRDVTSKREKLLPRHLFRRHKNGVVAVVQVLTRQSFRFKAILFSFLCIASLLLGQSPSAFGASLPSAPEYVEGMAGTTQAAITWSPPSSDGGEAALKYTARVWTIPPPTNSPMVASCTTTDLGCVITGLTSGSVYYVDVVASNSAGVGAPSKSKPISLGIAGPPPSNVTASRDSKGLLTVKWTPLASLAGATFAWYTAEAFTGPEFSVGSSYSGFCTEGAITASSCAIGGLKSNTTYYVQVRTVSSVGSSFPSMPRYQVSAASASPTATATASPNTSTSPSKLTAPAQVKAIALSKSVRVSWKAPSVTGGKVILSYLAGAFTAKGVLTSACKTTAKVFSCTINKLKPNQKTYIGVIAVYSTEVSSPMSKLFAIVPKS